VHVLVLALILTAANAVKPLHIDDTYYHYHAAHLARRPLEPFAFAMFWHEWPHPAIDEVCPPVVPYWWALGIRLLGDHALLWKLWFFPFTLTFVAALHGLGRRLAPGTEIALLWMTVLSPVFLPGLNLMVDIPALALALAAILLFLHAGANASSLAAVGAGILAGLAMQTKYSALVVPGVLLAYALLTGRPRLGMMALATAGLVFASWEGFVAWTQGAAPFLYQLGLDDVTRHCRHRSDLMVPLLTLVGGTAPALALAAAIALGARDRPVRVGAVLMAVIFMWLLAGTVSIAVFAALGILVWGASAAIIGRLWHLARRASAAASARVSALDGLLFLWLALEIVGYFCISPFPAVRRVLGIVIVLTLLAGRLASKTGGFCRRPHLVRMATGLSIVLGFLYYVTDVLEARARQQGIERAVALVRAQNPGARIWYMGHWGWQYFAERQGLEPVVPDHSRLSAGDWLIEPVSGVTAQSCVFAPGQRELIERLRQDDVWPLQTVVNYYAGAKPLAHRMEPRVEVAIWRLCAEGVPRSGAPNDVIAWAARRCRPLPPAAVPAVVTALSGLAEHDLSGRRGAALVHRLLDDQNEEVRQAARHALDPQNQPSHDDRHALEPSMGAER
jgi:hypothetical protein